MSNQNPIGSNNAGNSSNPFGSIFSGLSNLFLGNQLSNTNYPNAATGAMQYFNQIPSYLQQAFNPYIQQGQQAYGQLAPQYQNLLNQGGDLSNKYNQLINNPADVYNSIGKTYQSSPGYQWQVDQATKAGNAASAAGGMAGSPQAQQNLATTVNGLANQNYQNYVGQNLGVMNTGLQGEQGLYGAGLQGMSHLNDLGFQGSNELGESLANMLMSQANLSYAGQNNQNMMNAASQMGGAGATSTGLGQLFGGLFGQGTGGGNLLSSMMGFI